MRHSSISKNRTNNYRQQWKKWPSCKQPNITNNSVFSDPSDQIIEIPKPCISKSTSKLSRIFLESEDFLKDESLETIIRGVKSSPSERLFFKPENSKSISRSENKFEGEFLPFKESVAVVVDSKDPYGDFKKSMQEMIESNGLNDLEKLFGWYLKINKKRHHGFIVEAVVDMFLEFAAPSFSSSHSSSSVFSVEPSFVSCSSVLSIGNRSMYEP